MTQTVLFWIGFHLLIACLWIIDLSFFHRKAHIVKGKEACLLSGFWVILALLFNSLIYFLFGFEKALQFFTGYIIEKSLSVDNLFIFLLFFHQFRISPAFQHRILYWGIIGALVLRLSLIVMGVALIQKFDWMFYIFGGLLLLSGVRFAAQKEGKDLSQSWLLRFFKQVIPVAKGYKHHHFFVREGGQWKATSLFLVLLMIESADIIFALDSIPAVFAITTDPMIVYTSNVFAILGLRSLYFLLAASFKQFHFFKLGLAAILIFVGAKMLIADFIPISVVESLIVILTILGFTLLLSVVSKHHWK